MNSVTIIGNDFYSGNVKISGSKNACLPIIAGSIVSKSLVTITNVPDIKDVHSMLKIMTNMKSLFCFKKNKLIIESKKPKFIKLKHELVEDFRASMYFIGVMCALFGKCIISSPGGCKLGERPIDLHILALKNSGYNVKHVNNMLYIKRKRNLKSVDIVFPKKSVGATINAILMNANSNSHVKITNYSKEPETIDFINFMKCLGMEITRDNNSIYLNPGSILKKELIYKIIPDRIEAFTFITLGLLAGNIKIENVRFEDLENIIIPLKENGAKITIGYNYIIAKKSVIKPFDIVLGEYPLIPTDINPFLCLIFALTEGTTKIKDKVYNKRINACYELNKMKANINYNDEVIEINGMKELKGTNISGHDLRCSAALVIAGLVGNGLTTIYDIDYVQRGYESFFNKLMELNGKFLSNY